MWSRCSHRSASRPLAAPCRCPSRQAAGPSVGALECGVRSRPLDGVERRPSIVEIAIEIGAAEATEVRALPLVLVRGNFRGVLEWVHPVRIGTDAPGPQSGLELTAL